MIEQFFASRGFATKNLNPPRKFTRSNKALFQFGLRVSFGWGAKNGVVVEQHSITVRVPLFGYQLNVRLCCGGVRFTEDYIEANDDN